MLLRRLAALAASLAVTSSGLVIAAAPAQALAPETITSNYDAWVAGAGATTLDITINGFPNMTTSNSGYPYKLVFYGMTPNQLNTGTGCAGTWGTQTGVTFSAAAPGVGQASTGNTNPLGFVDGSTTYQPCRWDSTSDFRFAYDSDQLFSSTTVQTLSFPSLSFSIPAPGAGEYGVQLRGGGGWTGLVSAICFGNCPVSGESSYVPPPIIDTLDFDGNGGACSPTSKSGERGTWSTALTADNCSRPGFNLAGFSTSPTLAPGSVYVPPGGNIYFGGSNRFYAIWNKLITPPAAPTDVVAVASRNKVTLSWKAPSDDGGASIIAYAAKATPSGRTCVTRLNMDVNMLSCELFLPATNTKYTFQVQAANEWRGWGEGSAASNAVSPYDFREVSGSRENVLFGLAGTKVQARGVAPGLAGLAVTPEFKVGAAAEWSREANAAKVNADGNFSWSKSFPASANKQNVSVRFTYGGDAVSDTLVLARGAKAGSLSAPRNVKVDNKVNEPIVTWDAPKFDGGSKVTEYQVCLQSPGSATGCVRAWESPREVWDLRPGLYTVTVAAKNAKGLGPAAKASKPFRVTRASIGLDSRTDKDVIANVRYNGFSQGTKLTVEVASWEQWRSSEDATFVKSGTVTVSTVGQGSGQLTIPLRRGEEKFNVRLRLVTPNGETYSRVSWGATR